MTKFDDMAIVELDKKDAPPLLTSLYEFNRRLFINNLVEMRLILNSYIYSIHFDSH